MSSSIILSISYDIITLNFSNLITETFNDFANLFWVWHFNQSLSTIRYVLREMNWTFHFPSYFAYLVFKVMHCPFQWDKTVKEMASVISNPTTRKIVPELIYLIQDINGEDQYDIFPIYQLCPKDKNKQSFLHSVWQSRNPGAWILTSPHKTF